MVYFLQYWIVNPMLNLLKRTMTYPGFEPGTFVVAVNIPNHWSKAEKLDPEEPYASPPVNLAKTYFRGFRGKVRLRLANGINFFVQCAFLFQLQFKRPKKKGQRDDACVSFYVK
jgi:hypothetical protein